MIDSYSSFCDDFYFDMYINTELDLPTQRDTVLAFFERVQKQYPSMGSFYRRDNNEYCIEEDHDKGQYKWVTLETDRIGSGVANPDNFEDSCRQNKFILELVPYMLSVNHLDIDSLDVAFVMDFECKGNHDEIIAEALFASTPFNSFSDFSRTTFIDCSPAMTIALTEDAYTQARISIDSKTSVYDPRRKKRKSNEAITLSLTIRQYPVTNEKFDSLKSFETQCGILQELMSEKIMPNFVQPLTDVIVQKRLT